MVYNINPNELIEKTAIELKKIPEIKPPEWAEFVKTGVNKERPPLRTDWWYIRTAAILRSVYVLGPIGVSKLRTKYGSKRNRGYKPDKTKKSSGNIIRKALQQLSDAGFLIEEKDGVHKGRKITKKGKDFLDNIAKQISPEIKISKVKKQSKDKKEEKPEAKEIVEEKTEEKSKDKTEKQEDKKDKKDIKEDKNEDGKIQASKQEAEAGKTE
jgi:small subunit ribosomal protein S19e